MCDVVQACNRMSEAMVEHFKQATSSTLLTAGCNESTITTVRTTLNEHLVNFKEPLHFLTRCLSAVAELLVFNLAFHKPKKDMCDFCKKYSLSNDTETDEMKEKTEMHLQYKNTVDRTERTRKATCSE